MISTPIYPSGDPRIEETLARGAGVGVDYSYKPFAGIGSRATPAPMLTLLTALSSGLERAGYTLRSGGAGGADEACASGVEAPDRREIFLPWRGFNDNGSKLHLDALKRESREHYDRLMEIAASFHPAWHNCSPGARKLHARNVLQMTGWPTQDPRTMSQFVLCWTKAGLESGGTGQALRIAHHFEIPIYNLAKTEDRLRLYENFDWSGSVVGDSLLQ